MANTKTSDETAAGALDGTELVRIVQGGANRKGLMSQIKDYVVGVVGDVTALVATWTSSGTTYVGIGLTVTDTASAAASWLFRLRIGSTVIFGIRKDGSIQFGGNAFTLQIPDNTATGGNGRGTGAVDLQLLRTAATQVASGNYAFAAGEKNTVSGPGAVAIGSSNTVTNNNGVALGGSNTVNGNNGVAVGNQNTAGANSFTHGLNGTDRGLGGCYTHGGFSQLVLGDFQSRVAQLNAITTNATPAVLSYTRAAASASTVIVLPNDSTHAFEALIVARRTDANDESAAYKITGCIDRNASAGTTALVGSPVVTPLAEDTPAWDVVATADTTLGGLTFTVTGEAAKTIYWNAIVRTVEVVG